MACMRSRVRTPQAPQPVRGKGLPAWRYGSGVPPPCARPPAAPLWGCSSAVEHPARNRGVRSSSLLFSTSRAKARHPTVARSVTGRLISGAEMRVTGSYPARIKAPGLEHLAAPLPPPRRWLSRGGAASIDGDAPVAMPGSGFESRAAFSFPGPGPLAGTGRSATQEPVCETTFSCPARRSRRAGRSDERDIV